MSAEWLEVRRTFCSARLKQISHTLGQVTQVGVWRDGWVLAKMAILSLSVWIVSAPPRSLMVKPLSDTCHLPLLKIRFSNHAPTDTARVISELNVRVCAGSKLFPTTKNMQTSNNGIKLNNISNYINRQSITEMIYSPVNFTRAALWSREDIYRIAIFWMCFPFWNNGKWEGLLIHFRVMIWLVNTVLDPTGVPVTGGPPM